MVDLVVIFLDLFLWLPSVLFCSNFDNFHRVLRSNYFLLLKDRMKNIQYLIVCNDLQKTIHFEKKNEINFYKII